VLLALLPPGLLRCTPATRFLPCCCLGPDIVAIITVAPSLWICYCGAAGSAATWVTEVRACLISFSDGWWPSSCFALRTKAAKQCIHRSVSNDYDRMINALGHPVTAGGPPAASPCGQKQPSNAYTEVSATTTTE
jgi:hypothetical protein